MSKDPQKIDIVESLDAFSDQMEAVNPIEGVDPVLVKKVACHASKKHRFEITDQDALSQWERLHDEYERDYLIRKANFESQCPVDKSPDVLNWKLIDSEVKQALKEWDWSQGKGVNLHGLTGGAKTRMLWAIYRKLYVELDVKCLFLPVGKFESMCKDHYRQGIETEFESFVLSHDVVFFDDVSKAKQTDTTVSSLFNIFDRMTDTGKVAVFAFNYAGMKDRKVPDKDGVVQILPSLKSRFLSVDKVDSGRIEPFVRRIGEYCIPIYCKQINMEN